MEKLWSLRERMIPITVNRESEYRSERKSNTEVYTLDTHHGTRIIRLMKNSMKVFHGTSQSENPWNPWEKVPES